MRHFGLLFLVLSTMLSGCALLPEPHRIEITQGNVLEEDAIQQLRIGMTEEQVLFLLGTPAIKDMFHPNRWDYIHYVDQQHETLVSKKLSLIFEAGKLAKAKGDFDLSHLQ